MGRIFSQRLGGGERNIKETFVAQRKGLSFFYSFPATKVTPAAVSPLLLLLDVTEWFLADEKAESGKKTAAARFANYDTLMFFENCRKLTPYQEVFFL